MKEQTTRTPPKLRVLSAFLAVAMLLNLAPPTPSPATSGRPLESSSDQLREEVNYA